MVKYHCHCNPKISVQNMIIYQYCNSINTEMIKPHFFQANDILGAILEGYPKPKQALYVSRIACWKILLNKNCHRCKTFNVTFFQFKR